MFKLLVKFSFSHFFFFFFSRRDVSFLCNLCLLVNLLSFYFVLWGRKREKGLCSEHPTKFIKIMLKICLKYFFFPYSEKKPKTNQNQKKHQNYNVVPCTWLISHFCSLCYRTPKCYYLCGFPGGNKTFLFIIYTFCNLKFSKDSSLLF